MSQYIFLNAELDTRAVVAILFFGLSIAILFHNELKSFDRYLLFINLFYFCYFIALHNRIYFSFRFNFNTADCAIGSKIYFA